MFQCFDAPAADTGGADRLAALRTIMSEHDADAVIVPHADAQRNEYLPANAERLAWLTGFTGSAGAAIVTHEEAVLFVDGRYTLQAHDQAAAHGWTIASLVDEPPHVWLEGRDMRLAYDPWMHTQNEVERFEKVATLVALDENPIDAAWHDRPTEPQGAVMVHPFVRNGMTTADKLAIVRKAIGKAGAECCVLSDAASVSWLFNIRGSDIAHTPLVLAQAIIPCDGEPMLFIHPAKLNMEAEAFLNQVATLKAPSDLLPRLAQLSANSTVMLDADQAPYALSLAIQEAGGTVVSGQDPVVLPRAIKNETEIDGARAAHVRDGAAVSAFLAWLDKQESDSVDEIAAAKQLEAFRADMAGDMPLRDISFDTISGSGPHGAIIHYRVTEATNRVLGAGDLYLCDSGGQYEDGTTDITRTVAIGVPDDGQRRCYTLVLKGHIAVSTARFPRGTRGVDIDPLARLALWKAGLDYAHGTGHGVGSYLAVHEGPQNISKRGMEALLPGMIVSNEPGYYREGAFGIRIENLLLVREAEPIEGGETPMLSFETLTLAPYDRRLIDIGLLTDEETDWLDAYHARVFDTLYNAVPDRTWLQKACAPLTR